MNDFATGSKVCPFCLKRRHVSFFRVKKDGYVHKRCTLCETAQRKEREEQVRKGVIFPKRKSLKDPNVNSDIFRCLRCGQFKIGKEMVTGSKCRKCEYLHVSSKPNFKSKESKRNREYRAKTPSSVIISYLKIRQHGITSSNIPEHIKELVQAKADQIKLKRLCRALKTSKTCEVS